MKSNCCNRCKYVVWHCLFSIWAGAFPDVSADNSIGNGIVRVNFFPKIVLKYCLLTTELLSTLPILSFVSKCSRANSVISMTESHLLLMQCHLSAQRSQASNSDFQYWSFVHRDFTWNIWYVFYIVNKNWFMRFVNHYILFHFTQCTNFL